MTGMTRKRASALVASTLLLGSIAVSVGGQPRRTRSGHGSSALPDGVVLTPDVAYGLHSRQRFDVYSPQGATSAPVLFMVHGGAWRIGDKGARAVVENKVARWVPKGVLLVSTNYRMLPEADALAQVDDVAQALVRAQAEAERRGGDRSRFVLMGHSAGAHLVALLTASPERALRLGATPWLGAVLLDSAALDVVEVMERPHLPFYDQAFGADPARWRAASPFHQLHAAPAPLLAVCSSLRRDSCDQARAFAAKAAGLGGRARSLPEALSHQEINEGLGKDPRYTGEVESFLASLDSSLRNALAAR